MKPTLIINPSSDSDFASFVHECAQNAPSPDELQESLRVRYPSSVARRRVLSGESNPVWYVYREGHWVPPEPRAEGAS